MGKWPKQTPTGENPGVLRPGPPSTPDPTAHTYNN